MNATALHRQVCSDVAVTSVARRPRAIVVVLGQELDHYTELYHKLSCSTISTTNVEGVAAIGRETARLVRVAQLSEMGMGHVPIMVHVMGRGGRRLVEELERQIRSILDEDISSLQHSRSPSKGKTLNASTRSLFTNETDPMSSDDDDDESSHHEESSIIDSVSPLKARRPLLHRQSPPQPRCRPSPSVHRIDMERTGISLQHSLNPEEKAYRRDLEMFCSHLSLMLWDMPPPPSTSSRSLQDFLARIVLLFIFIWNTIKRWVIGGTQDASFTTTPQQQQELAGLSLSPQHALLYCDDKDESLQSLLERSNVVMQSKLKGTRKQHGAEYVAFVQQTLDRISSPPSDDEDDGWSSDEDE